jgi:hypothetical protein
VQQNASFFCVYFLFVIIKFSNQKKIPRLRKYWGALALPCPTPRYAYAFIRTGRHFHSSFVLFKFATTTTTFIASKHKPFRYWINLAFNKTTEEMHPPPSFLVCQFVISTVPPLYFIAWIFRETLVSLSLKAYKNKTVNQWTRCCYWKTCTETVIIKPFLRIFTIYFNRDHDWYIRKSIPVFVSVSWGKAPMSGVTVKSQTRNAYKWSETASRYTVKVEGTVPMTSLIELGGGGRFERLNKP